MIPPEHDARRSAQTTPEADSLVADEDGLQVWRGIDPEAVGTEVFLARAVAAAGTHIPPHTHTADTVAYLASGRATFRSGQNLEDTHELVAGDWLFVPAGMVHVEETPADSAAEFLFARDARGGVTTYLDEPITPGA